MHLDIDEFLNIHVGDGKITDLIAALPDADAIALTWRMFGNNGIIEYKDRLITDQFAGGATCYAICAAFWGRHRRVLVRC